ncbi:hypothetical protein pdul_cds_396 [Pandoravirus dulcis]|uniref:Uncharacterized protein n=1 Tax=Pandoravirus dulcis TaxID=1349409 RepID=S4VX03_9VIRU|nr:hypothetical protein pdul_cds_396 [Pandoravirus dulcis]AGO82439.1 hypothetical protein pdul_cds_396 [Pandoravirus dulcis]
MPVAEGTRAPGCVCTPKVELAKVEAGASTFLVGRLGDGGQRASGTMAQTTRDQSKENKKNGP